jgi:ATP-dependent DNA helicase RecG
MMEISSAQAAPLVTQLLAAPESRSLDFKRVSGKMVHKALETACAFANTDGGALALGVEDPAKAQGSARLFGLQENPEAVDELQRKLRTQFNPSIDGIRFLRLPCTLRDGSAGQLMLVQVPRSDQVHSVVDGGTWTRLDAGNRQLLAQEVAELSYRRGVRSAESEMLPIPLGLLQTGAWRRFVLGRGLKAGEFADQLCRIGLADTVGGAVWPRRAAVLLFADEPSGLLAAQGARADIRLFVVDGKAMQPTATPNYRKKPLTLRGPVADQIDTAVAAVLRELEDGLLLSRSGFKSRHLYPERVVKEAIVNAVLHRDYRLNRDIFIRLFDNRIEVESPGTLPGAITPANIHKAGSKARNPLLALNLREFPEPPNIDAGEGVPMMFAEMAAARLYPPQYRQTLDSQVESVTVTLLNLERPTAWDEVSHWIDSHGSIANADLRRIAAVDTLKASKMLATWVEQGLLAVLPGRGKRNTAYVKPARSMVQASLLSEVLENKPEKT